MIADGVGRQVVLVPDHADLDELAVLDAIARAAAFLGARLGGKPRLELAIQGDARQLILVLEQQLALAAADVDQEHVVPGLVALVEADGDGVGKVQAEAEHLRLHALDRRQVAHLAGRDLHREGVEILVAALVLEVEHVRAVRRPAVEADAALAVVGDDARRVHVIDRRHPDVEHAVLGCQPRQPLAVGRELRLRPRRIAEQLGAWNEGFGGLLHGRHPTPLCVRIRRTGIAASSDAQLLGGAIESPLSNATLRCRGGRARVCNP